MKDPQPSDLVNLHSKSCLNRDAICEDRVAFCFHCLNRIPSANIKKWIDFDTTALCPRCGVDSLIPKRALPSSPELRESLLYMLQERYFGKKDERAYSMKDGVVRSVSGIRIHEQEVTMSDLQRDSHNITLEKGFWDKREDGTYPSLGEKLMLTVSELAEAMEELRKNSDPTLVYTVDGKPEGFGVELADAVIRIADLAEKCGLDLGALIRLKMRYNATRPHRHGKKF